MKEAPTKQRIEKFNSDLNSLPEDLGQRERQLGEMAHEYKQIRAVGKELPFESYDRFVSARDVLRKEKLRLIALDVNDLIDRIMFGENPFTKVTPEKYRVRVGKKHRYMSSSAISRVRAAAAENDPEEIIRVLNIRV